MTNPPTTRREARLAAEAAALVDPPARQGPRTRVIAGVVGGALVSVLLAGVAVLGLSGGASPRPPHRPVPAAESSTTPSDTATPSSTAVADDLLPSPSDSAPPGVSETRAPARSQPAPVPVPAPVASPQTTPSPSATAPGNSGSAPGHMPKPKPTNKP